MKKFLSILLAFSLTLSCCEHLFVGYGTEVEQAELAQKSEKDSQSPAAAKQEKKGKNSKKSKIISVIKHCQNKALDLGRYLLEHPVFTFCVFPCLGLVGFLEGFYLGKVKQINDSKFRPYKKFFISSYVKGLRNGLNMTKAESK